MITEIAKGDKFLCIKDCEMHEGGIAYIKGKTYTCEGWAKNGNEEGFNFPSEMYSTHTWPLDKAFFEFFEPVGTNTIHAESNEDPLITLPTYYDNSKGSLYKIATERGWNFYLADIVKRLERGGKKDPLRQEIEKSIGVLQLWLKELDE